MAYLLDADVFIRAKNLHYGLDFCPGFWDWLISANTSGIVYSIERVADEIEAGADELVRLGGGAGAGFLSAARPFRAPLAWIRERLGY